MKVEELVERIKNLNTDEVLELCNYIYYCGLSGVGVTNNNVPPDFTDILETGQLDNGIIR